MLLGSPMEHACLSVMLISVPSGFVQKLVRWIGFGGFFMQVPFKGDQLLLKLLAGEDEAKGLFSHCLLAMV